jgi:chromosome segregation ATPase
MKKVFFMLGMAAMASVCFARIGTAEPDKVILLQDENFFLQEEIKGLHTKLVAKDNVFKKCLLEKEIVRQDLAGAAREKEKLEEKVGSLTKMLSSCDAFTRQNAEQDLVACRTQLKDALEGAKALSLKLEEKDALLARAAKKAETLQAQVEMLTAEKASLLQSIKKLADKPAVNK